MERKNICKKGGNMAWEERNTGKEENVVKKGIYEGG